MKTKQKRGFIFVLSGPSGSGKTTLAKKVVASGPLKKKFVKSVSYTTRPKRPGEVSGKDYFFISENRFKQLLKAKKILEWTRYLEYYYATPKDFVDEQLCKRKNIVLCLDFKGVLRIKRLYPKNSVSIFIYPPSLDELDLRIKNRCPGSKEERKRRLALAKDEIRCTGEYDYRLVNDKLIRATAELKGIILNVIKSQ